MNDRKWPHVWSREGVFPSHSGKRYEPVNVATLLRRERPDHGVPIEGSSRYSYEFRLPPQLRLIRMSPETRDAGRVVWAVPVGPD